MIKLKQTIYFLICLITINQTFAQSGIITYSVSIKTENKPIKEEIKETYNNIVALAKTQKFLLKFNKQYASFTIQEKLTSKNEYEEKMHKISRAAFTSRNDVFTDILKKITLEKTSEGVLIKKENQSSSWKLTNESKKIDTYLCYKATLEEHFPKRDGTTGSRTITAWFAPSLPYSYGPKTYYGLPGLILELTEKNTTYLASNIELSEKELKITFPSGKTISQEEYDKKLKDQMGI